MVNRKESKLTSQERQAALQNLVQLLHDNAGNRLTLSLVNGVSVTHGQFLDTLLVTEPSAPVENGGAKE